MCVYIHIHIYIHTYATGGNTQAENRKKKKKLGADVADTYLHIQMYISIDILIHHTNISYTYPHIYDI